MQGICPVPDLERNDSVGRPQQRVSAAWHAPAPGPAAPVEKENPLRSEAHHAHARAWAKQTRNQIHESGQWPKNLPLWREIKALKAHKPNPLQGDLLECA